MTATVAALMVKPTPSVHAADSLVTVARKLRAHASDAVVVHGDEHTFVGIVTRADIIDQCVADGGDPATMTAGSLVGSAGPFARPDQDAGSSVIEAILCRHASFLPVVDDDGKLVGIITLDAVAAHLVDSMEDLAIADAGTDIDAGINIDAGIDIEGVPYFETTPPAAAGVRAVPNP